MPKLFNRVITFHIMGEIYDNETSPESIIKNYSWNFHDSGDGKIHITGSHNDVRGRIIRAIKLPKIHRLKKPDTEFFLNL